MKFVLSLVTLFGVASLTTLAMAQYSPDPLKEQAYASMMYIPAAEFYGFDQNGDNHVSYDDVCFFFVPNPENEHYGISDEQEYWLHWIKESPVYASLISEFDENFDMQVSLQEYLRQHAREIAGDTTNDAAPAPASVSEDDHEFGATNRLLAMQLQQATSAFIARDKDGDKRLSGSELTDAMITSLLLIDENLDGAISLNEALSPFIRSSSGEPAPVNIEADRKKRISLVQVSVNQIFQTRDTNNDDFLVGTELPWAQRRHHYWIDKNQDGKIDKLELTKYIARRQK